MKPAGFFIRLLAYLVDAFFVIAFGFMILAPIYSFLKLQYNPFTFTQEDPLIALGSIGILLLINIYYFAFAESSLDQATIGKNIFGLIVVNENAERMSFKNSFVRYLGKMVSSIILGFGFWIIPFSKNYQGLHDKIASTYVIHKKEVDKTTNIATAYVNN